ncbi:hypothetical protein B0H16DRAFT_1464173 [Mycena metata]|uniref:Uncharacterized protein n=1 Tax=Mycena metata TaxID=1033252 RepID=A0AAD7IG40_9AGAR|nr:hypothetical protein B0H16DRAFT_1464173 [Mycena metata]
MLKGCLMGERWVKSFSCLVLELDGRACWMAERWVKIFSCLVLELDGRACWMAERWVKSFSCLVLKGYPPENAETPARLRVGDFFCGYPLLVLELDGRACWMAERWVKIFSCLVLELNGRAASSFWLGTGARWPSVLDGRAVGQLFLPWRSSLMGER